MKMSDDLILPYQMKFVIAFNDPPGSIPEECGLDIIPISGQRVQFIGLPKFCENFIFIRKESSKIYQDHDWVTTYLPPPYMKMQSLFPSSLLPGRHKSLILNKIRVFMGLLPHVRTQQDIMITKTFGELTGLG